MSRFSAVLVLAATMLSLPVMAQVSTGGYNGGPSYGGSGYGPGVGTSPGGLSRGTPRNNSGDEDDAGKKDDKPIAPPPAIPGAQPDADAAVVPADKLAAEMSPNDALFDAINRGDLAAAKDALSRGAQLDAHNVLGQTPTDAAIDLSRNDITFLLLSMRGTVPTSRGNHGVVPVAAPGKPGKGKPAVRQAAARLAVAPDRGTPNPSVGFIGF